MKTQKSIQTTLIIGFLCIWQTASASGQNLLVNGDFEAGNTGFSSEYKFARLDTGLLTYDIVKNPSQSHFLGASFGDHTSGAGLMFTANGANDLRRVLWRQVVSVVTNTAYQFSFWATPAVGPTDPDPSRIRMSINGNPIGSGFQLSNPPGAWQNFSADWNSGTSALATIELRLETTEQGGNDLAIDDLRFDLTAQERLARLVAAPPGLVGWWPGDGNAKDLAGKEQRLYINGERAGVAVIDRQTGWLPGSELFISIAGQAMNGLVDEAAIYNRSLTAGEILAHFVAGSVGMAKAPVFSGIVLSFPGNARLSIKGQAGKAVTIQSSTNLMDWVTLVTDPNLTGTITVTDVSAGASSRKFYRAITLP
jgi:hypothetical protein